MDEVSYLAATQLINRYNFDGTIVELYRDPDDKTAAIKSLVIKVNGEAQPICRKLWCGHVVCTIGTPAGTLELPSCARTSPPEPKWTAAGPPLIPPRRPRGTRPR